MSSDKRPPVVDWATDFDHTDSEWVTDPYPIWDDLRRRCPVAHSDRYGGTWLSVPPEGRAPADRPGPAVPRPGPSAAAPRLLAQGDRRPGAPHAGPVPGAPRRDGRPPAGRRRRRLRPAHPPAGDHRDARLPAGGR